MIKKSEVNINDGSGMIVDIHVIQMLPPSCANRDDTGSPKQANVGGTTRLRQSSQSWKRAVRDAFRKMYDEDKLGVRTQKAVDLIVRKIEELSGNKNEEENRKAAETALKNAGIKMEKGKTQALLFISGAQIKALAQLAADKEMDKALYKKALDENPSIDIAMFGRMVAGENDLKVEGAAYVSHVISTHAVEIENDYFTALDDLDDNSNAAMLGTTEFASATVYRYASIDVQELLGNDAELTGEDVKNFIKAFILSMPQGRITSFANWTIPDLIYVTIRDNRPFNLSPAFDAAIKPSDRGFIDPSKEALGAYAANAYKTFINEPEKSYISEIGDNSGLSGERIPFNELLDRVEQDVDEFVDKNQLPPLKS